MARILRDFVRTGVGQVLVRHGGSGPAVIVLHNSHGSSEATMRSDFLPRLADRYTVFAPDLPGSGISDQPPRRLTIPEFADSLAEVTDDFGVERASLVGHLAGSSVALELAVARPERVDALIVSALSVWTPEEIAARRAVPALKPWTIDLDGRYLKDLWKARRGIAGGLTPEQMHIQFMEFLKPGPRVHELLMAVFEYDAFSALPRVKARTLALTQEKEGAEDRLARIRGLLPSAHTAVAPWGTLLHELDAEAFLKMVTEFIG